MEIAPVMMQQQPPADAAAGGMAAGGSSGATPEGIFALFFAQKLSSAATVPAATVDGELLGKTAEGSGEPTEEQASTATDATAELQAMAALQQMQTLLVPTAPQAQTAGPEAKGTDATKTVESVVNAAGTEQKALPAAETKPALEMPALSQQQTLAAPDVPAPTQQQNAASAEPSPVRGEVAAAPVPAQQPAAPAVAPAVAPAAITPGEGKAPAVTVEAVSVAKAPEPKPVEQQNNTAPAEATATPATAAAAPVQAEAEPRVAEEQASLSPQQEPVVRKPAAKADHQTRTEKAETVEPTATRGTITAEKAVSEPTPKENRNQGSGEQREQQFTPETAKPATPNPSGLAAEPAKVEAPRVQQVQQKIPEGTPAPEHEHIANQVKEKLAVHEVTSGTNRISLSLHPEELGELKITLRMDDQRLKVDILAQNQTVKEALVQHLDTLRESLSRQNITVDRFDVSTGGGSFNETFQEGRQAGQSRVNQAYPQMTAKRAETEAEKIPVAYWTPRENSLVDVRF